MYFSIDTASTAIGMTDTIETWCEGVYSVDYVIICWLVYCLQSNGKYIIRIVVEGITC